MGAGAARAGLIGAVLVLCGFAIGALPAFGSARRPHHDERAQRARERPLARSSLRPGTVGATHAGTARATRAGMADGSGAGTSAPAQIASDNAAPSGSMAVQPVLGMPASSVQVIGASPGESPGEAWAQGKVGAVPATVDGQTLLNQQVLVQYTSATGTWQLVPLVDAQGNAISAFDSWLAGSVTTDGGVVLAGSDNGNEALVVRNPGGAFSDPTSPPASLLAQGQTLFGGANVPTMAAIDDTGGTGVLIAPSPEKTTLQVLHYVSGTWTAEPIVLRHLSLLRRHVHGRRDLGQLAHQRVAARDSRVAQWRESADAVPAAGRHRRGAPILGPAAAGERAARRRAGRRAG